MTKNITERIDNAIKDIEKIQIMFRQKYGEECLADKEIEEVLKIVNAEHEELEQYRSIGTVEECQEAVERQKTLKPQEVLLHNGRKGFECRNCGNELSTNEFESAYCHWCGQRLED